jgi:hypothetical protein
MAIEVDCRCGKRLRVRDELAGKKARCPGCGEVVSIPSPITRQTPLPKVVSKRPVDGDPAPPARASRRDPRSSVLARQRPEPQVDEEEEDIEDSSPLEDEPRRRRKKKKKRSSSTLLFTPLVTLFGINFTPLKLIIMAIVLLVGGVSAFLYFNAPEATVKVVDVYDLEEDLGDMMQGQPAMDVIMHFLFKKEIPKPLVLHEHKDGKFLMVKFKISEKTLKKLVGERYENFIMKKKDVVLQGDGDPVYPIFIYEPDRNTPSVTAKSKPAIMDDGDKEPREKPEEPGPPIERRTKTIAPSEETPWTHKGVLEINPDGKSVFEGVRGMRVFFDHGPLPSHEIKMTWNEGSHFWYGVKEEEVPAEIFLYAWRITCLFPKPEFTKNLKLTVLGKNFKMDYP